MTGLGDDQTLSFFYGRCRCDSSLHTYDTYDDDASFCDDRPKRSVLFPSFGPRRLSSLHTYDTYAGSFPSKLHGASNLDVLTSVDGVLVSIIVFTNIVYN